MHTEIEKTGELSSLAEFLFKWKEEVITETCKNGWVLKLEYPLLLRINNLRVERNLWVRLTVNPAYLV